MKFVFWGTPNFAVYTLEELEKAGYLPELVVTAPDIKVGRGNNYDSPPVKKWAERHSIPILQPEKINESLIATLQKGNYEVFILTAYGKILPPELLKVPKYGILNNHPSLLPKLRGASPVRTAILTDQRKTGTTIIVLDEKMDHGKILFSAKCPISETENFSFLFQIYLPNIRFGRPKTTFFDQ